MARIFFMGTPEFAQHSLKALVASPHEVVAVASQPPRRSGRGMKERLSPVHEYACQHDIPVMTPLRLRDPVVQEEMASFDADLAIVAAYGLLLPSSVLGMFPLGCMNLHASLLPRWRGAAPIQRAIMAGDDETGICFMRMTEGLDEGPVHDRVHCTIHENDTFMDVHDRLTQLASVHVVSWVDDLVAGVSQPVEQTHEKAVYASKITKAEAELSFAQSSQIIARKINALSPFPGAFVMLDGQRIKFLRAQAYDQDIQKPQGSILDVNDQGVDIACAQGVVRITRLQRAGKGPQDVAEFLRGFSFPQDGILG